MTGRGADLLIIDDPHSEQDALSTAYDNTYEWYTSGPNRGTVGEHHHCATDGQEGSDELIITAQAKDSGRSVGYRGFQRYYRMISCCGTIWNKDELLKVKACLSPMKWNAQWQQILHLKNCDDKKGVVDSMGRTRCAKLII